MKRVIFGSLAVLLSVSLYAAEYDEQTSREIVAKTQAAMHQLQFPYTIGKSTLTLSVDCQEDEAAAKKAIKDKVRALQLLVDRNASDLRLGEEGQKWGYDLEQAVSVNAVDPVSNQRDKDENKYFWTNRCTGEQSETPTIVDNVYSARKVISVWYPNEDTVLNGLSDLVTELEATSESDRDGVKVTCNSVGGSNFDLDVDEETKESAWKEIKEVARKRALLKKEKDLQASQYNQVWDGVEVFTRGQTTELPQPEVVNENGEWVAKFSKPELFSVFYNKKARAESRERGHLVGTKNYQVVAEASTKEGLYATVRVAISKACAETKADAEAEVAAKGEEVLKRLRKINQERNSETEKLIATNAAGSEYNPAVSYRQVDESGKTVNYYYDGCSLEVYESQERPELSAWKAQQVLTIVSSDLDALKALSEELKTEATKKPDALSVGTYWTATAKLAVLETVGSDLEVQATRKFLERGSEFQCDAADYSYACLSKSPRVRGGLEFMSADGAPKAAAYAEKAASSSIKAEERGMATFEGSYLVSYTVRKVLKERN